MMTTKIGVQAAADYLNGAFQTGWIPGEQEDLSSPTLKKPVTAEYVTANQIKIVGLDWTDRIQQGTKIRYKQGDTYKYDFVSTITANTDTTLTLSGGSTVENEAITEFWFSNIATPIGWTFGVDYIEPLGVVKEYYGSTLPPRHLWVDGKTIGDAQSGATARANSDVYNLFAVLWDSVDNTNSQIKIYNSLGILTEKGASAAADFAAHKAISLPDKRGRVGIGLDNMDGTSANVVTNDQADIVGGTGGAEEHTLKINEMPSHTHPMTGGGTILTYVTSGGDGAYPVGGTNMIGSVMSNQGGGQSHNNMQPWVACNYIMRY